MWQRKEAQKKLKHAITFHGVSLMNKMYLPTVGLQDWQKLLADPEKQWRTGYSARTIAYAWEAAKGHFPPEVERIFPEAGDERVGNLEILLEFPEWKVYLTVLATWVTCSQNRHFQHDLTRPPPCRETRDESTINKVRSTLMLRQPTHFQEGEVHPMSCVFISIKHLLCSCFHISKLASCVGQDH